MYQINPVTRNSEITSAVKCNRLFGTDPQLCFGFGSSSNFSRQTHPLRPLLPEGRSENTPRQNNALYAIKNEADARTQGPSLPRTLRSTIRQSILKPEGTSA